MKRLARDLALGPPGFDYGNARLRGMKARLLSRAQVQALAHHTDSERLINALADTPYAQAVEAALARASGADAVFLALRHNLVETMRRVPGFFAGREHSMVTLVLRAYDVFNIKSILRGLSQRLSFDVIEPALLPIGDLGPGILQELGQAPDMRAATDRMSSLRLPQARPLIALRTERPGATVIEFEIALERWYFAQARQAAQGFPESLRQAIALGADVVNLITALRLAHAPGARQWLRQHNLGRERLFVGPGRIRTALLARAAEQSSLGQAVALLAATPYRAPLTHGLRGYRASGQLSALERALARHALRWNARRILAEPLGIGVFLGYLALKVNEARNLRWVARGVEAGLGYEAIQAELEFVD